MYATLVQSTVPVTPVAATTTAGAALAAAIPVSCIAWDMLGLLFAGAYIGTSSNAKAQRLAGLQDKTDPHGSASASCEDAAWGRKTGNIKLVLMTTHQEQKSPAISEAQEQRIRLLAGHLS